jgi:hypothetical protein
MLHEISLRVIATPVLRLALLLAGLFASIPAAQASDDQDRVAIESFRGPHAQRLQGAVETGLMGRYYLVPDFSVEQMARRRGVAMTDPEGMAQVGRALQVRAFLSAEVQKKRTWHVAVLVRSGDTGAPLGRFVVADRRLEHLESTLATRTSRRVRALLARASSQGELDLGTDGDDGRDGIKPPALSASASAPEAEAPSGAQQPGEVVEVGVETRVFNRTFSYNQNLSGLADYRLQGALAATAGARFYPLALLGRNLAPIGISAALEYGIGVGSRLAGSEQRTSTDVHGYSVGLAYRVRLGGQGSTLTPTLGYALSTFNAGQTVGAVNVNVDYRVVKPGLDARWAITDRLALRGHADYLHVLSSGSLSDADRFPRAEVRGMEGAASVAFALARELEIEAGAGVRRFGIATHVIPGDRVLAGGAVDQTTWLGLGAVYRPSR